MNQKYGMDYWYWPEDAAYMLIKKYKDSITMKIIKKEWKETGPQGWSNWVNYFILCPSFQEVLSCCQDLERRMLIAFTHAKMEGVVGTSNIYEWYYENYPSSLENNFPKHEEVKKALFVKKPTQYAL